MTAPTAPASLREEVALREADAYLILKSGMYYRSNRCGYTGIKNEAGRYTEAEALAEAAHAPGIVAFRADDAPEYAPGIPDEQRIKAQQARIAELEARDAERDTLKAALAAVETERDHAIAMAREPIGDTWDEIRRLEGECRWMAAEVREYRDALKHHCDAHDATKLVLAAAQDRIAEMDRRAKAINQVALIQAREIQRLNPAGQTPPDLDAAMDALRAARSAHHPEEMPDER